MTNEFEIQCKLLCNGSFIRNDDIVVPLKIKIMYLSGKIPLQETVDKQGKHGIPEILK